MRRHLRASSFAALTWALASGCTDDACTLAACESELSVDYGDIVVNEPYALTIVLGGETVSVTCLSDNPDDAPPPEFLECDAGGFEITGERADNTTVSVAVVPLSTGEAVIPNALVTLTVQEVLQPNGPDCEPTCYRRVGSVPPNGGNP
jgi:hypothetical protein